MSHYKTLGVEETASSDHLKRVFRELAMKCHPDHHPGDRAKEARFKEIAAAYEVLNDPVKRAEYDRQLSQQRAASSVPYRWPTTSVPQVSRGPSAAEIIATLLGIAAVAIPLIAVAAAGGGGTSGESGSDGSPLPPRGPDGRFQRRW